MLKSNMAISFFKKLVYNVGENIKDSLQSKKNFVLSKIKNCKLRIYLVFSDNYSRFQVFTLH